MGGAALMKTSRAGAFVLALVAACGSQQSSELPPLGEVVVVVDTDVPLAFAERLRVDVFEDGRWIESRDLLRPSADSWPASFSVFSPDPGGDRVATVRLRVYAEGRTREYHGERFLSRRPTTLAPGDVANVDGDETPRLLHDGIDVTPEQEPIPLSTIDRLLRVRVSAGRQAMTRVVLRGECIGTMADVAHDLTCVDQDATLVPVADAPIEPLADPPASVLGTFPPPAGCDVAPREETFGADGKSLRDGETCAHGGLFFFGVPYAEGLIQDRAVGIPAVMSPFLIDRWEVTVGRLRRAVKAGFVVKTSDPLVNDVAFDRHPDPSTVDDTTTELCSYSTKPMGREDYAVTCISPQTARAFCQFEGGDLPTEAQWYWAAVVIDRATQSAYPWGENAVDCDHAVIARTLGDAGYCVSYGFGPVGLDADAADVSIGLDLVGMHGGVAEWTRDAYHRLYEGCWYSTTLHDPSCVDPTALVQATGGVSWRETSVTHDLRRFWPKAQKDNHVGFRCVRSAVAAS